MARTDFPLDFRTLRTGSIPNQALALPPGFESAAKPHFTSPVYRTTPRLLLDAFERALSGEPRLYRLRSGYGGRQIELVQRSRLLRFQDLITVEFVPLDPVRASLAIWSRARLGLYDFGVNHARLRRWFRLLSAAQAGALEPAAAEGPTAARRS